MRLSRRRFLTLSACALASPAQATTERWTGSAFGAEVSLDLRGANGLIEADLQAVIAEIRALERRFSLYDPASDLSKLNASGQGALSPQLREILALSHQVHAATQGLFDPTIQPLWEALAQGEDVTAARDLIGLDRVTREVDHINLGVGQKLSFNGIAQGYATDRIAALLAARGYGEALINMGEFTALGGSFRLGLEDPEAGRLGALHLSSGAMATSSPAAMTVGGETHILHPKGGAPMWSTVTVVAKGAGKAALADAASTAFCLMSLSEIEMAKQKLGLSRVYLVDVEGNLTSL
ncbi:FAD:protein FMN transferase [Celeribacter sp. PS-C1]|uniref:FAD:protein FMN transferase n=1 Tax=Celeribacter sp. PS-C1 TaxID=2820813 RepID=UPI001C67BD61|nr:FAD:protein FMN transferase [Celeribacter sp. PS-C1]MBW6417567.1 FAD:protein FMN transferase [Celeribacter sp. PS-C1]